jgi:hypothetical protein
MLLLDVILRLPILVRMLNIRGFKAIANMSLAGERFRNTVRYVNTAEVSYVVTDMQGLPTRSLWSLELSSSRNRSFGSARVGTIGRRRRNFVRLSDWIP